MRGPRVFRGLSPTYTDTLARESACSQPLRSKPPVGTHDVGAGFRAVLGTFAFSFEELCFTWSSIRGLLRQE